MAKRFAVALDAALFLAEHRVTIPEEHFLVAPTLLRSQMLSHLYAAVRRGDMQKRDAELRLDHLRKLRIRLLGDRVLQQRAWSIASRLDWTETYDAEYIAVTQLQADALVTGNVELAAAAKAFVAVCSVEELLGGG